MNPDSANADSVAIDNPVETLSTLVLLNGKGPRCMDVSGYSFPVLVKDLALPRSISTPLSQKAKLSEADETLRLRFHFGGMHVVCLRTSVGSKVLAAGYPGTGVLRRVVEQLSSAERALIRIEIPDPIDEFAEA